jgi:iron(III) transport system substrate-binding protein
VKSRFRHSLIAAVALTGTLALATCGSSSNSAGGSAKATITLYSGQHEQTTASLVSEFEKETGIKVKVRNDDEAVLADQIAQEGSNSPADVFYTENTPPLEFLQGKNLLSSIASTALAKVPTKYNSTAGKWIGVSARVSVLDYNTKKLKAQDLPTSVMDLAEPQWKGKIGIAPGETDFQPIVTSIAKAHGKDAALAWLKALKANAGRHNYPDNESLADQIDKGQVEIGVINHYYWYRQRDEVGASKVSSAIAFFAPADPGYVIDVSGAAVLRSSNHQAEAQQLVDFLVSHSGEEILAHSESYEYPLGSGVQTAKALRPFDQLQPNAITLADLGDGQAAVALLQQAQLL